MPNTGLNANELFALTLLLCTPSELHFLWLNKSPFLGPHMKALGFSDQAVTATVQLRATGDLATYDASFDATAIQLQRKDGAGGQFPEYSDGPRHPVDEVAKVLVTGILKLTFPVI